jgi:hypothetical protein
VGATLLVSGTSLPQGDNLCKLDENRVLVHRDGATFEVYYWDGASFSLEHSEASPDNYWAIEEFSDGYFAAVTDVTQELQLFKYDSSVPEIITEGDVYGPYATIPGYSNLQYLGDGQLVHAYSETSGGFGVFLQTLSYEIPAPAEPTGFWEQLSDHVEQGAS